jgi:hypothetical protein
VPVLAEVPELAQVQQTLREVDLAPFAVIEQLIHLRAHGIAEATTGVAWIPGWPRSAGGLVDGHDVGESPLFPHRVPRSGA